MIFLIFFKSIISKRFLISKFAYRTEFYIYCSIILGTHGNCNEKGMLYQYTHTHTRTHTHTHAHTRTHTHTHAHTRTHAHTHTRTHAHTHTHTHTHYLERVVLRDV